MVVTFHNFRRITLIASVLLITLALSACGGVEHPPPAAIGCAGLNGLTISASSIALPTRGAKVTAATEVSAGGRGVGAIGPYCLVTGNIKPIDVRAPDIQFQLALPDHWNKKIMMLGGGGFNGSIPPINGNVPSAPATMPGPLGRGYAVFASDSGHQAADGTVNGAFSVNAEAYDNFSGDALKKTHDAALFIVRAHYAVNRVSKAYFAGGSTGGREGLTVAQRWPDDWDGVIAFYPAYNFTSLSLQQLRVTKAFAAPGAYLDRAKRALLQRAVMSACDMLDGVADGIVSDVQRCNSTFNPATAVVNGVPLRCADGADDGDACLSDMQINALNAMNQPLMLNYPLASGETQYPGFNVYGADLGVSSDSPLAAGVTLLALGTTQPSFPLLPTAMFDGQISDQFLRYTVMGEPHFNSLTFDPQNAGKWATRISHLSDLDANGVNLSAFNTKDGKLLLVHGAMDLTVSARATEAYYRRLQSVMGASVVRNFVRFYEVPGMQHMVGTQFNLSWDSLSALEGWVERGIAPTNQIGTDTEGVPGRTRPLCSYPSWPRYKGSGDINSASSFTCVMD